MKTKSPNSLKVRRRFVAAAFLVLAAGISACEPAIAKSIQPPVAAEFGLGPRASSKHVYTVVLEPREPLRLRQLQSVTVRLTDAEGRPIEGAYIMVDGGMPEHGHGLPTKPRMTRALGGGMYEIEGVRFSMGGWWELKLAIDSPAGNDSVTFNLSL